MLKTLLMTALFLALPGSAIANQPSLSCSPTLTYRGNPLHSGIEFAPSTSFDLSGSLDGDLAEQLNQTLLQALKESGAPGVTAAVGIPGHGIWSMTTGLASTEPEIPVGEDAVFWWASAGKLFTASIILQLAAEEQLTLRQTIDPWFPDYPQAENITIEHLLTHTGGVFSFQQDLPFRERTGYTPPDELINISARHGANFCPGEHWSYSNTGYVMLAQIIEAIEGKSFPDAVTERILYPLNLTRTTALLPGEFPPNLALGHEDEQPADNFRPSLPFGAGNIVASAEDMVVFLAAMLAGEIYPRHLLTNSLEPFYPMFDNGTYYGQGIMLYDIDQGEIAINWLGHSGGTPNTKAVVAFDLNRQVFVAVAVNADAPAEAIALRLVEVVP
jgi:D-alanyl-D-alanine carboxypeptidase